MYVPVNTKDTTRDKIHSFNIYGAISYNTYKILLGKIWDGPLNGYYPLPKGSVGLTASRWTDSETEMFKGLYMPVNFDYSANAMVDKRVFFSDVLRRINR